MMGSFRYKAVDERGAAVAGTLVADSSAEARERLRKMQLFPEQVERVEALSRPLDALPGRRMKAASHVAVFTRQCAVLLASGVQLVDALGVLSEQCEYPPLSAALTGIRDAVGSGSSLAEGMAAYPLFFDRSYVGMVAAGEKSGTIDVVFSRLAEFLERRRRMQSKLSTALIYPSILVLLVTGVLVFLAGVVVPRIEPLLNQPNRPLPLATAALFAVSHVVWSVRWAAPLALVLFLIGIGSFKRSRRGGRMLDGLVLRIPLAGRMVKKSIVSRFAMSFGTLLRTGVPALEALELLSDVTPNAAFAGEIRDLCGDVTEGRDISHGMQASRVFPPMVGYMVAIGERSGNLAEVLEHVGEVYDLEVEIESRRLLALLEPVLILGMAAVVGFIAMSLMVTIMELSNF